MNNKQAIKDIYIRVEDLDIKQDKFYSKKIYPRTFKSKYVAIILFTLIFSTSISVGNNFFTYHSKSSVGYLDEGLYTAISNNYMQNISMKYKKSNDVGVKVSNILMDRSKIYIVFDFEFYKALQNDVHFLELPDMIITDENNNIIFSDNGKNVETYKTYCEQNNIDLTQSSLTATYPSKFIDKTQKHIKYLYILNAENEFPDSQKLFIKFRTISLYTNLTNDSSKFQIKNGTWNLEVNLDKSSLLDKENIFTVENNDYIENVNMNIGNTCSFLTFDKKIPFDLHCIEIIDKNNNNCYSPLKNIENVLKIENNRVYVYLPLTLSDNNYNLILHIISDKFDVKLDFVDK